MRPSLTIVALFSALSLAKPIHYRHHHHRAFKYYHKEQPQDERPQGYVTQYITTTHFISNTNDVNFMKATAAETTGMDPTAAETANVEPTNALEPAQILPNGVAMQQVLGSF